MDDGLGACRVNIFRTIPMSSVEPSSPEVGRRPGVVGLRPKQRKKTPVWFPPRGGRGGIRRRGRRRVRTFVRRDQIVALVPAVSDACELAGEKKLFLRLGRHTLIEHVVRRLRRCVGSVVVATPPAAVEETRAILGEAAEIHAAGPAFAQTLRELLELAAAPYVVVHNISWPFASPRLIREVILAAMETGAASAVNFADAPIGRIGIDYVTDPDDPRSVAIVQSPGAYRREVLEHALLPASSEYLNGKGIWELLHSAGAEIAPVKNEEWNIRIETRLDWEIARRAIWPVLRQRWKRRRMAGQQDT